MYKHVIWDFDGTLFDSYPIMAGTFCEALAERGIFETVQDITALMKVSMAEAVAYSAEKYGTDDAFFARYREIRRERERIELAPYEGAKELLHAIVRAGRKNYLFTHRGNSAKSFLDKYGMLDDFADVVTSADGFSRKPSPDAILHLLKKHGIPKAEALMVGDRDLDVLSGVNAGIDGCFIEGHGECPEATHSIKNLAEMYGVLGHILNK